MRLVSSALIWFVISLLVLLWLPIMFITWIFDRDPSKYRTGRLFRKLGQTISRVNPNWKISKEGFEKIDDRNPYVIVSNHLSHADIPVISNLPWEMKWIAKKELFEIPVLGRMLKMSGDIPVDRESSGKKARVFKQASKYLKDNVSVMFFPEGTRSRTGKINRFAPGAFELAIRNGVPILPIALDGTQECLPKKDWIFKPEVYVKLKVLEPIDTKSLQPQQAMELMERVRKMIAEQVADWRGCDITMVDSTLRPQPADGA